MTDPWARPDPADSADSADDANSANSADHADGADHAASRPHGRADTNGSRRNGHGDHAATPDPETARTFGRPDGVRGAFAARGATATGTRTGAERPAPPAPALVSAFGRPTDGTDSLQRRDPPGRAAPNDFWADDAERDPWRDPEANAGLTRPALGESPDRTTAPTPGPRLSARELVLGRRVQPAALALLAAVALLIGAVGGVVGYAVAGGADSLTDPGATVAEVAPGKERPPGSVADVAARVVPAVVSIEVRSGTTGGTGSGVVIDTDGHVVTNNHVVAMAADDPQATLQAVFSSGLRAPAQIVGRDPQTDIAVVKVNVANPRVAQLGRSADLQVGDAVIAVGSPLGLVGTVTEGIVSSVRRPERLDAESADANPVIDAIQTDAAINPGNSGGALVDSTGAVVGINTAIRTLGQSGGEGGSIGLGFAIPIDDVRDIAQSLIRTGTYQHTDLAVNAKSVTDGTAEGAQILNVRQGGPGARAGLAEGDVVVRVDDRSIASADELTVAVREHRPGQQVTLAVVRGGRPLTLQAAL